MGADEGRSSQSQPEMHGSNRKSDELSSIDSHSKTGFRVEFTTEHGSQLLWDGGCFKRFDLTSCYRPYRAASGNPQGANPYPAASAGPDLLAALDGRLHALELKRRGETMTKEQEDFEIGCREQGVLFALAIPRGWGCPTAGAHKGSRDRLARSCIKTESPS